MRALLPLVLLVTINGVLSKNSVKSLTESLGQEVIEIGAPIKELPPNLEEEPSAENDEEDRPTSTVQPAGTKREFKKTTVLTTTDYRRRFKEQDKPASTKPDDEEARIEKELAEIYKDNLDYKSDSSEVVKEVTPAKSSEEEETDKPIERSRNSFKFQPDMNNRAEVERFRTSIDVISCDKKFKLSGSTTAKPNSANEIGGHFVFFLIPFLSVLQ